MSNFTLRVISGLILFLVIGSALWVGGFFYWALCFVIGGVILYEWLIISGRSVYLLEFFIVFLLYIILALTFVLYPQWIVQIILLSFCCLIFLFFLKNSFWTFLGFFYSVIPVTCLLFLRSPLDDQSFYAIESSLFLFLMVSSSDIGGYVFGKTFGGKKLIPSISPNKTISGSLGSFIFSVVSALFFSYIFYDMWSFKVIGLAMLLSLITQIGDIAESAFKRYFSVKDSSQIIPGHGGFMDRFDGLIWTSVGLYCILYYVDFDFNRFVV